MSGWELLKLKLHLIKKCLAVTPEVSITDIAEKLGSTSQNERESKHFFFIMPDQIALIIMFQPDTIAKRTDLKSEEEVFTIEKSIPLSLALAIVSL